MNGLARMIYKLSANVLPTGHTILTIIKPQALRPGRAIARSISSSIGARITRRPSKRARSIEHPRRSTRVRSLEARRLGRHQIIVSLDRSLQLIRRASLRDDIGRQVDGWCLQEQKLPRAGVVEDLDLLEVLVEDFGDQCAPVRLVPAVADVVDAHPDAEESVGGCPWRVAGLGGEAGAEFLDLVDEGEHGWVRRVGGYERGVGGGAAAGEVVGVGQRLVVVVDQVVEPVLLVAVGRGVAWEWRVAEDVRAGGLGAVDVEAGLGVAVAEVDDVL